LRESIVDPNHNFAPVVPIGDPHPRSEGKVEMGGGEAVTVETLSAGGFFAVVAVAPAVPCRQALLHGWNRRRGRHDPGLLPTRAGGGQQSDEDQKPAPHVLLTTIPG
jgi:hypothetical protein